MNGIHVKSKCYEHQPEAVIENDSARRSDMIIINNEHHDCQIIDFAVPHDTRVDVWKLRRLKNTWIWPGN